MKFNCILWLGFPFFLSSCKKDSVTLSSTIFINNTGHQVSVKGYQGGIVQTAGSFSLLPNETKSVFTLNNRGIGNGLSFGGYYRPLDSLVVTFDNLYSITHYKPNLAGSNVKSYAFSSGRNLFNEANYLANTTKNEKHRREWEFKYSFVEQDYLDAK